MAELVLFSYIFSLSILMIFGFNGFLLYYLEKKHKVSKHSLKENAGFNKTVTVQLPLYNEYYVVERLINSVCELDYPKDKLEIQVLDDSTDETVSRASRLIKTKQDEGFDIRHIRRANRKGFKAGALKEGLKSAKGEFIAIFDADFVPKKDFLKKVLRYFSSPEVGMVQTRWEHLNERHSLLTKVQAFALDGHFVIEQSVKNKAGYYISFNGTGGVWRKECIIDSGDWHTNTLTEDLDLSYRAQLKGWKFIYLKDFTTPAELPSEINSLKAQQYRWTKGAVETAKKILPQVWHSPIPLKIKLISTFHLTGNIAFPFILLTGILNVPLIFIKNSGPYDIVFNFMSVFLLAFISVITFYLFAQKRSSGDWGRKFGLFPVFIAGSIGFAVNNSRAVFEALLGRKSEFIRTPKFKLVNGTNSIFNSKYTGNTKLDSSVFIETILAGYCAIGVIASVYFLEIAALPFQLLFCGGFGVVSVLSLKHSFSKQMVTQDGKRKFNR